jgi:hypothetical protein
MNYLQISFGQEVEIDRTWSRIERDDWLHIEEIALVRLKEDLASRINLLSLPVDLKALPEYIGYEQSQIDDAVLQAAFSVLGRPRFADCRETFYRDTFEDRLTFEDDFEDPMLTEMPCKSFCKLRDAIAWSRSSSPVSDQEVEFATPRSRSSSPVSDREVEFATPRPPSSPPPAAKPSAFRRRFNASL